LSNNAKEIYNSLVEKENFKFEADVADAAYEPHDNYGYGDR
jgi:hypothetical protein